MGSAQMSPPDPAWAPAPADARAWTAPVIDGAAMIASRGRRLTEAQREEERRLFAEAEAAGKAAGLAAAQKDIAARIAALEERSRAVAAMLEAMSRPLAHLDDQVHQQIASLAVQIARAVVR